MSLLESEGLAICLQKRAQETVNAILDAVIRLLKRSGTSGISTNRIAEAAGVSIGSVYQYFPDKRAIFVALHDRHIEQVDRVIHRRLRESLPARPSKAVKSSKKQRSGPWRIAVSHLF